MRSVAQCTTDDREDRSDLFAERPLGRERPRCCDGDLLRHGSLDRELGTEPYGWSLQKGLRPRATHAGKDLSVGIGFGGMFPSRNKFGGMFPLRRRTQTCDRFPFGLWPRCPFGLGFLVPLGLLDPSLRPLLPLRVRDLRGGGVRCRFPPPGEGTYFWSSSPRVRESADPFESLSDCRFYSCCSRSVVSQTCYCLCSHCGHERPSCHG